MSAAATITSVATTVAEDAVATEGLEAGSDTAALPLTIISPAVCRYYQRGICRFGAMCRFSHDLSGGEVVSNSTGEDIEESASSDVVSAHPTTSHHNWANAPVFVPKHQMWPSMDENAGAAAGEYNEGEHRSWADVVGAGVIVAKEADEWAENTVCPYQGPCPYGPFCKYGVHMDLCEMCDQYCLHPKDVDQRRKHNQECLQQHEQNMELSFAIARSKDKTCGICFDTIMEKGREKRFGILPNCNHIFCLECIRKWRQAKQFEHKITRSCPECRVSSDFVCPSAFWVETKEEKDKLLNDYRSALGVKDCKYFKKGDGKCPFGNKCFYKHALPNGKLVDVGCPKRARKLHRSSNEIIDLLDIYLWEFVEHRDHHYHWSDLLSSTSEDSSDISDHD